MTLWILLVVLLGLAALIGYFLGAVRSLLGLAGALVGAMLALPLGPTLAPLFPLIGIKNPVWIWIFPPLVVVLLVEIVLLAIGFAVHWQVAKYFKFRWDDVQFLRWGRVNQRIGACVGMATGLVFMVVIGVFVYVTGYFSVQLANESGDPFWLRTVNQARLDLQSTGFDRVVARFDPASKTYYEVSDLLGTIHQNYPTILARMADYPPFMILEEKPEIQELGNDKEFLDLISSKASLATVLAHPRAQGLITHTELVPTLLALDRADLRTFLETGKTPKYEPFKLLGRWKLEVDQVVIMAKKLRPEITAREMRALRAALRLMGTNTFKATPDNRAAFTIRGLFVNLNDLQKLQTQAPPAAAAPAAAPPPASPQPRRFGAPTTWSAEMRARYGGGPPPTLGQPSPEEAPAEEEAPKIESKTFAGTWEGEGDRYELKIQFDGRTEKMRARIEDDILYIDQGQQRLVYTRLW